MKRKGEEDSSFVFKAWRWRPHTMHALNYQISGTVDIAFCRPDYRERSVILRFVINWESSLTSNRNLNTQRWVHLQLSIFSSAVWSIVLLYLPVSFIIDCFSLTRFLTRSPVIQFMFTDPCIIFSFVLHSSACKISSQTTWFIRGESQSNAVWCNFLLSNR